MASQPTKAELAARARKDVERARARRRRRTQRLNQRERDRNLSLYPVVVQHPLSAGRPPSGQQAGRIVLGRSDRWIQESAARLTRERAAAEAAP